MKVPESVLAEWDINESWQGPDQDLLVILEVHNGYEKSGDGYGRPSECEDCPPVPPGDYEYTVSARPGNGNGPFDFELPFRKPKATDDPSLIRMLYVYSAKDNGGGKKEKMKIKPIGTVVPK